jgi:ribulose-5-phosphate 4-epimerase/fuculose-1-phosphate aldolase
MRAKSSAVHHTRGRDDIDEAEWGRRVELAACYRLADRFGFSDIIWSHITARVPGASKHFLLNRFGLRYDEVTASNLIKLDLEGKRGHSLQPDQARPRGQRVGRAG